MDFALVKPVRRWAKFFIAVALLPLCVGMGRALGELVSLKGMLDTTFVPLGAGAGCMFLLYHWLAKPMWLYVFGHEFTHAAAAMACGGRVKGMKVTNDGGHVLVTKDNFFITLAPYFIPFYSAAVLVVFALGRATLGWGGPWAWGVFCWALGMTYAFHILLSWNILHTRQPDITSQGYAFSAVIIFIGNILVLLLALPFLMDGPGVLEIGQMVLDGTLRTFRDLGAWAGAAWAAGNSALK